MGCQAIYHQTDGIMPESYIINLFMVSQLVMKYHPGDWNQLETANYFEWIIVIIFHINKQKPTMSGAGESVFAIGKGQPPPQVLRFSHGRGERETSDWWYTARDHGKGTDSPVVSFPPSFAHIERDVWVRGRGRGKVVCCQVDMFGNNDAWTGRKWQQWMFMYVLIKWNFGNIIVNSVILKNPYLVAL